VGIVDIRKQLTEVFTGQGVAEITHNYRGGGMQEVVTFQLDGTPQELVLEGGGSFTTKLQRAAEALRTELSGDEG
jgi:hypothetical protein